MSKWPIIKDRTDLAYYNDSGMISASYEAEIRTFTKVTADNGVVFLIAEQDNAADNTYSHDPKDKHSQGFAGRTISFVLKDGSIYEAQGPWHTNSQHLLGATGLDITDKHRSKVAVGLKRGNEPMCVADVVYIEEENQIGKFNRGDTIAQKIADDLNTVVYCLRRSEGGGSCGPVKPSGWTKEQYAEFWDKCKN